MNNKDLTYFPEERILAWCVGYAKEDNGDCVVEKIKAMQNNLKTFVDKFKVKEEDVQTIKVTSSRRYKYMRIYFARLEEGLVDKDIYKVIGEDWSFIKWYIN